MTFKTLEEANELLQTLGGKPEEIARIFKGCTFNWGIAHKEMSFTLTGCLSEFTNCCTTDDLSMPFSASYIQEYTVTALPKSTHHTREQIQARINEINANKAERIEKGRSESNEKKRLQRQLDALPRFEKGAVYRLENPKAGEVWVGVSAGIDSDGDSTFYCKFMDYGIPSLTRMQVMPQHVEHYSTIGKLADPDDCNLQWLLDGKWDETT